jgi:hypothetical protein
MPESRRTPLAPWITASIAGAVLLALLLVYFLALRPDERDADAQRAAAKKRAGDLTAAETIAVNAAATEMLNLVTFSRAHFADDFQRALAGTTGALRSDVADKKSTTQSTITQGKFDLYGKLTHKALEGPVESGKRKGYIVLVTINGYHSDAPDQPVQQNLEVTVLRVKGKWLAADVTNIGITS